MSGRSAGRECLPIDASTTELPSAPGLVILPRHGMDLPRHLERVRADFVAQALVRTRGNQKRAGALLGLSERMIGYLIQERSLQPLVAIAQDATVTEDEALYAMRTYLVGRIGVDGWF